MTDSITLTELLAGVTIAAVAGFGIGRRYGREKGIRESASVMNDVVAKLFGKCVQSGKFVHNRSLYAIIKVVEDVPADFDVNTVEVKLPDAITTVE